ncbi:MAG: hypothetical protein ACMVY4_21685 [Minwuia sp.]|uniref:hypothetical protein n=1 Tax=Minwuia sp. TaxID=2493630 RepID=UPI003A87318B
MFHPVLHFGANLLFGLITYMAAEVATGGEAWTRKTLYLVSATYVVCALDVPFRHIALWIRPWRPPDPLPDNVTLNPSLLEGLEVLATGVAVSMLAYLTFVEGHILLTAMMFPGGVLIVGAGLGMMSGLSGALHLGRKEMSYRIFHRRFVHRYENMTAATATTGSSPTYILTFESSDPRSQRNYRFSDGTSGLFFLSHGYGDYRKVNLARLINAFRERALNE